MEIFSIFVTERMGRKLISIQLGERPIGSIVLENEDADFIPDLESLMTNWNEQRKERL